MTSKATVVEILDEARSTGRYDGLVRLLYVFLRGNVPNKDDIVHDALMEVLKKLSAGETSLSLAPKLRGFLNTCALRIQSQQKVAESRLGDTGDEVHEAAAPETSDPAVVLVRLEEMDEKIARLIELRESSPRHFEALVADAQEVPIPEHFEEKFGKKITPANSRKLRERAKSKLNTGLEQIRKDSSS